MTDTSQHEGNDDRPLSQSGIDPYLPWILGAGARYYFLTGLEGEEREWLSLLLRLSKGVTAQSFALGEHITDREKRSAWRSSVRIGSLFTRSRIGADKGPYITVFMRRDYLMKDFFEHGDLRRDLRNAIESATPGLPLDRNALFAPEETPPPTNGGSTDSGRRGGYQRAAGSDRPGDGPRGPQVATSGDRPGGGPRGPQVATSSDRPGGGPRAPQVATSRDRTGGGPRGPRVATSSDRPGDGPRGPQVATDTTRGSRGTARGAAKAASTMVVMGIIDDGIAFAHERFRKVVNGQIETRIEHWWLQDGPYKPNYFPFLPAASQDVSGGCELDKSQIDDLLQSCISAGVVDDDLVYRRARLNDFQQPGHKSAAWRKAHGTHVMDLAAGYDSIPPVEDRPIICVQLPVRVTADTSGGSLFTYAFEAMVYILDRASLIPGGADAPVVINLSYGRLEGPHDGTADIELAILFLSALTGGRLRVVLPAGNADLSRTHAQVTFTNPGERRELRWRVLPDDFTPSYAEIWLPRRDFTTFVSRISLTITSPTGEAHTIVEPAGIASAPVQWGAGPPFYAEARYYFSFITGRSMFRISLVPTADFMPGPPLAPAGIWKIELTNIQLTGETVHAWVQRDDTLYGFPLRGRQSYFEDASYVRFDHAGRDKETDDAASPVRRESTINSIATGADPFVAGGYIRKEPMAAAKYSAAGAVVPPPRHPDAMMVSEDSRVHVGVLAAGSNSGSVIPMGGTSVAAPQMARWIADDIANAGAGDHAAVAGAATPMTPTTPAERSGAGRIPTGPLVRVLRYVGQF